MRRMHRTSLLYALLFLCSLYFPLPCGGQDQGTVSPRQPTPPHDGPPHDGLLLWLDADQPTAPAAGRRLEDGPLPQWHDLSGRGNHLTAPAPGRFPTAVRDAATGRPAVRFDDDMLQIQRLDGLGNGDRTFHVVIVFQAAAGAPAAQRLLDLNSRAAESAPFSKRHGFWVGFQQGRYIPRLGVHSGDEGEAQSAIWDNRPHLLECIYIGEHQFEIHVDGRRERRALFSGTHFLGFEREVTLALGQHFGADHDNTWFRGDLFEVLLYSRKLTTSERIELARRLSNEYDLRTELPSVPVFEQHIRPLLAAKCFECHGASVQEKGLDLRTVTAMLQGGEAGPVIVPGHPRQSELLKVVESEKMPPDPSAPLTEDEVALLQRWIAGDAPALAQNEITRPAPRFGEKERKHWAWQRMERTPPPPAISLHTRSMIDAYLLADLQEKQLSFSPEATPQRLARRLYQDLLGVPPTPTELTQFLRDRSPMRYERLVDRLLASPRFGERWGRLWLDVSGYVDVVGSDNDAAIIKPLPGKWRYRDYVIRSYNRDKPFDQFVTEQLAGDELQAWRETQRLDDELLETLTATGFLLSANDDTDANELNTPDVRHHVLQRTGENVANALFAVTLQCAKCHDHKYEAISQLDYYRFEAIFAPVFNVRHWVVASHRTRPIDAGDGDGEERAVDAKPVPDTSTISIATEPPAERTPTPPTHVLRRGDWQRPGLAVDPELFEILTPRGEPARLSSQTPERTSGRRLALARAVTDPQSVAGHHVARVYVNRIWQRLFGRGLVATVDNFGVSGAAPTHPALLDALAMDFIEADWQLKPLIRRLVTTRAYRQTSIVSPGHPGATRDPENILLWKMPLRRLDSEQLRDAILTVSESLDGSMGGAPIPLVPQPDGKVVLDKTPQHAPLRRSVYILARRNYHLSLMRVFDQPIVARTCAVRQPSAMVTQSLALLHDEFLFEQAEAIARVVQRRAANSSRDEHIQNAWKTVLGRTPDQEELRWCRQAWQQHVAQHRPGKSGDDRPARTPEDAERFALVQLCHMLLNTNEFLYVE